MASVVRTIGLCLALLALGCGSSRNEEAARKQLRERYKAALGQGQEALRVERHEEAVKHFEEATRLIDDAQAREFLREARAAHDRVRRAAHEKAMQAGRQALADKKNADAVRAFEEARSLIPDDGARLALQAAVEALRDEQQRQAAYAKAMQDGREALAAKNYAAAATAFEEALRQTPGDRAAEQALARAEVCDRAERLRQAAFASAMQAGSRALVERWYVSAALAFKAALVLARDDPAARQAFQVAGERLREEQLRRAAYAKAMQVGRQAMASKQYEAAVNAFKDALRQMPGDRAAGLALKEAGEKHREEQLRQAAFARAMQAGRQAMEGKRYAAAVEDFQDALRKMPDDRTAVLALKEAGEKLREEQLRQAAFARAMQAGRKAIEEKEYQAAVQAFKEALVQMPDDLSAGLALKEAEGQLRRAAYEKAMQAGRKAMEEKKYVPAVDAFREALRHLPNDQEAGRALKGAEFRVLLGQGRDALAAKQYVEAMKALQEAVNRKPEDQEGQALLKEARAGRRTQVLAEGQTAMKARRYPEAVRAFTEVQGLTADAEVAALLGEAQFQALLQRGREHVAANQFVAAVPVLEEAHRSRPQDNEARELLQKAKDGKKQQDKAAYDKAMTAGDQALARKDYDGTIKAFKEALTFLPNDATAVSKLTQAQNAKAKKDSYENHVRQGKTWMAAKNYPSAVFEFQAALADMPGDAAATAELAQAKKQQQAKEACDRAVATGDQAMLRKDYDGAIRAYKEALAHLPNDATATSKLDQATKTKVRKESYERHMLLGKNALAAKNYPNAVTEFRLALADMPGDAAATTEQARAMKGVSYENHVRQGKTWMAAKNHASAVTEFQLALFDMPGDAAATAELAQAKKQQQAKEACDRAVATGDQAMLRKDYDGAIRAYKEALAHLPNDATATSKLDQATKTKAKKDQDKAAYDRAIASGDLAMQRKDYGSAIRDYNEALSRQPNDPTARSKLIQAQNAKAKKESYERHMRQGKAWMNIKAYQAAASEFQQALFDMPGDFEANNWLQKARQGKP